MMNTDTVYVLNQAKMPNNIRVIVDNMPDSISVNGTVAVSNITEPIHYDSQLDSLVTIGMDVTEYGFGYTITTIYLYYRKLYRYSLTFSMPPGLFFIALLVSFLLAFSCFICAEILYFYTQKMG